jgi:hypothetical protein
LEHQFVQVEESKDDADNDKRERRGPKRMSNWMSDMFLLSPIKDETKSKVTASKSPKKSSSPPPVINVDKTLKENIIAPHKRADAFAARITGIFSSTGSTDEEEEVNSRQSRFEYYQRMSDLSETSAGSNPSGNRGSNQSNLSATLREVLELIRTDDSVLEFDEGQDSWSDAGESIMVGSSLFGMDANDSTRSSGSSNQAKLLASAVNYK